MAQNNPFIAISSINVKLTVKEKNDAGFADITAEESGTFVPFNKSFADVRSITVSARRGGPGTYENDIMAIWTFHEEGGLPTAKGFVVWLVKRSDGTQVAGEVGWTARGV